MQKEIQQLETQIQSLLFEESTITLKQSIHQIQQQLSALKDSHCDDVLIKRYLLLNPKKSLKKSLQSTALKAQKQLVHSQSQQLLRQRVQSVEDPLKSSQKLTQSLQEALEMMNLELSRSVETAQSLQTSSQSLSKTRDEYALFSVLLGNASGIVGMLQQKEIRERWMLVVGLLIFFGTVGYIFSKRIWIPFL